MANWPFTTTTTNREPFPPAATTKHTFMPEVRHISLEQVATQTANLHRLYNTVGADVQYASAQYSTNHLLDRESERISEAVYERQKRLYNKLLNLRRRMAEALPQRALRRFDAAYTLPPYDHAIRMTEKVVGAAVAKALAIGLTIMVKCQASQYNGSYANFHKSEDAEDQQLLRDFHKAMWDLYSLDSYSYIRNRNAIGRARLSHPLIFRGDRFSPVYEYPFTLWYDATTTEATFAEGNEEANVMAQRRILVRQSRSLNNIIHDYDTSKQAFGLQVRHDLVASATAPLVAYYQTPEKRAKGIRTPIKLGKYLQKYYPHIFDGSAAANEELRKISSEWEESTKPLQMFFTPFTTSDNEDESSAIWRYMYVNGPRRCMKGSTSVRVYAYPGNGLRLAYVTTSGKPYPFTEDNLGDYTTSEISAIIADDPPVARCITVTLDTDGAAPRKEWVRIYPEDSGRLWHGMENTLRTMGYQHGNLNGIKGAYIDDYDGIVCPYVDSGNGGDQSISTYGSSYIIFGGGELEACNTNGYAEQTGVECCECGCHIDEDDAYYPGGGDYPYCESCRDDNYVYAYGRRGQDEYRREDCIYCETDGEWYVESYANSHDVFMADCGRHDGNWYHTDDLVQTSDGLCHIDDATKLDEPYEGNEYALDRDVTTTHDGRTIHDDDVVQVEWHDGNTYTLHKDDNPEDFLPEKEDDAEEDERLAA